MLVICNQVCNTSLVICKSVQDIMLVTCKPLKDIVLVICKPAQDFMLVIFKPVQDIILLRSVVYSSRQTLELPIQTCFHSYQIEMTGHPWLHYVAFSVTTLAPVTRFRLCYSLYLLK